MPEHVFLINPAAGKADRTDQVRAAIAAAFRGREARWRIAVSQKPGDCAKLARAACQAGRPVRLYACGGDGTLNEVVRGAADFPHAAITHYPGGSGNDFIKLFSEPAAFLDLPRLIDGEEAAFDLIEVEGVGAGLCALNVCSVGLDARVADDMQRIKRLPLCGGRRSYILSAGLNLIKGLHAPYEVELDNGERFSRRQTLVCALNGRYYGGSFHPVPEAEADDALMEVLLVNAVSRLRAATIIGQYQKGRCDRYPRYIERYRCKSLTIRAAHPDVLNLDGEIVPWTGALTMRLAPGQVRFVYPRGLRWRHDHICADCTNMAAAFSENP